MRGRDGGGGGGRKPAGPRETRVGDLPEAVLVHAIALTSPRDACRCAAVSRAFRAAADSDHVWGRFIPEDQRRAPAAAAASRAGTKKDAYLGLCEGGGVPVGGDGGGCRLWLDRASGAKCYALSARRLSLPCRGRTANSAGDGCPTRSPGSDSPPCPAIPFSFNSSVFLRHLHLRISYFI